VLLLLADPEAAIRNIDLDRFIITSSSLVICRGDATCQGPEGCAGVRQVTLEASHV
jgi:hypothetical protein